MPNLHRLVPFRQTTATTCWEGCARAMWVWRHGPGSGYREAAARALAQVGTGILNTHTDNSPQVDQFFQALGMAQKQLAHTTQLQVLLLNSPAILIRMGPPVDHAAVVTGTDATGLYVLDPWDGVFKLLPYAQYAGAFAPTCWYWPS